MTATLKEQLDEARSRAGKLQDEISDLASRDELTPEQSERLERQVSAVGRLQGEVEALKRAWSAETASALQDGKLHYESGDGPAFCRQGEDPWRGEAARSFGTPDRSEMRSRAMRAVERSTAPDDGKAAIAAMF